MILSDLFNLSIVFYTKNEDGKYVAVNNLMIAIDEVDGISIDEAEFVSKEYIADLLAVAECHMATEESDDKAEEDSEQVPAPNEGIP